MGILLHIRFFVHPAIQIPSKLIAVYRFLFGCFLDLNGTDGWNPVSVGWYIPFLIECIEHDLSILNLPLLHLLLSDGRTVLVIIKVSLFYGDIDTCMDEMKALIKCWF